MMIKKIIKSYLFNHNRSPPLLLTCYPETTLRPSITFFFFPPSAALMEDAAGADLYQPPSMLSASGWDDGVNSKREMMV